MNVALSTPSDRLAQSRERLRQAMRDILAAPDEATNQYVGGLTRGVIEAASSWWAQHPLRITSMLAADAVKAVVQPMAQRHPLGLVLGAFLMGGLLAWIRPWRWILTAGLLPQFLSKAMAQVPPQSWIVLLASLAQQQCRPKEPVQQAGPIPSPSHTSAR